MTVEPKPPAPAWTRTLLTRLDLRKHDQRLPRGKRYQRDRRCLFHRERVRLEGEVILVDGDVFSERPDAQVAGSGVDFVADLVVPHAGADPHHDAREIVSEHERRLVLQKQLEFAVANQLVQRVDAGGTHSDQDVAGSDGGIWHLGGTEAALPYFWTMNAFMCALPLE